MILDGTTFPNAQWGYNTEIEMALDYAELGNGKINIFDNGVAYDKYSCKCKFLLLEDATHTEVSDLFAIYSGKRGEKVLLKAGSGFFPFSVGVEEPTLGYPVYIKDVKNKGAVDSLGTQFQVELTFILAYDYVISWNALDSNYCHLGNLTFAGYSNIMMPQAGFKPKHMIPTVIQNTHGGRVYGMDLATTHDEKTTSFTLELRDVIASNILNKLINTYRTESIEIEGSSNYFIFAEDSGDNTTFDVKLSSPKISIKHKAFENHSIKIEVVKV